MLNTLLKARVESFYEESNVYYFVICMYYEHTSWILHRRYSEFFEVHAKLETKIFDLPTLPPKSWFKISDPEALDARREALEAYVVSILTN